MNAIPFQHARIRKGFAECLRPEFWQYIPCRETSRISVSRNFSVGNIVHFIRVLFPLNVRRR